MKHDSLYYLLYLHWLYNLEQFSGLCAKKNISIMSKFNLIEFIYLFMYLFGYTLFW